MPAIKTTPFRELAPEMAVLSGMPVHRVAEDMLIATLRRMGLEPSAAGDCVFFGARARSCSIVLLDEAFELVWLGGGGKAGKALSGRHPGSETRQFVPPAGPILVLRWRRRITTQPRAQVDAILTTVALLNVALLPRYILWGPARLWSYSPAFANAIEKYSAGDILPVLRLVGFDRDLRADGVVVTTRGLASFTGQELASEEHALGLAETVRRLARLALDMFDHGAVERPATIDGIEPGERIVLTPQTRDGATVVDVRIERARGA